MSDLKTFNIRMPKELWVFLKNQSIIIEKPMNSIIIDVLEKMKKKLENKLTSTNANV